MSHTLKQFFDVFNVYNKFKHDPEKIYLNEMLVEIVVVANSDFSRENEYQRETFLCVFNDGSVIVSNLILKHRHSCL